MICLLGTVAGFGLAALSITLHSFSLLITSRVVAGFTSGSQSIAQAAIVDLSNPKDKARNLGWLALVLSLGFIGGPLLGGLLSDKHIYSHFSLSTPFYFAALLSLFNTILLKLVFHETFKNTKKKTIKLHRAIEIFISAFTHKKVRNLSIMFAIFIFGWSSFYSFISLFLLKVYSFSVLQLSLFMAVLGLGFGIGSGVLVNYFTQRYPLKNIAVIAIFLGAIFTAGIVIIPSATSAWLLSIPMGCAMALAYSVVLTAFSNQVNADHQGWIMGITGSVMAFVWSINAVTVGLIADISAKLPLIVCAVCLAGASLFMRLFYKGTK
jgi:predicted MFS family arabinose efflux permease